MCRVFFFNDTATTEIYTLSLHDALPILHGQVDDRPVGNRGADCHSVHLALELGDDEADRTRRPRDRKSTRLNSSHANISYAVFCLKKKKTVCCLPDAFCPTSAAIIQALC